MTKQDKVAKVMHEWKNGRLTSNGKKVTDYDQAIAIALSEAGLSKNIKKDEDMNEYSKGGNIIERRYVNKDEDYETRYAKDKPSRMGYKDERMFAEGGETGKKLKGYRVYVFESSLSSSQNVLKGDSYVLVTDGIQGDSSQVDSDEIHLKLVKRNLFGKEYLHAEPVNVNKRGNQMFGGKFVWSTDSRFRDDISESPIQLHDRVESYAVGGEIGNTVSFKGDYGTPRSGVVKEKRGSSYIVATDDGDRLVDSYEVISFSETPIAKKKRFGFFAEGGEIQSKIDKLQSVVNSKMLPESVKEKARKQIAELEKELHESKETKAEEKAEHKAGGSEYKSKIEKDLEKELHRLQRDLNSSRLQTYIEGDNSEEEKARQRERTSKIIRMNEVLSLLNEIEIGKENKMTGESEGERNVGMDKEARLDKKEELNATIQKLYGIESKAEDLINYQSGGIQGQSVDKIKKYVEYVNKEVSKLDVPFGSEVFEVLEDENAHSLNLTLGLLGFYKNKKDSGEWAKQHEQYAKVIDVVNEVKGGGKAKPTTTKEIVGYAIVDPISGDIVVSKKTIPQLIQAAEKLEKTKGFEDMGDLAYEIVKKGDKNVLGDKIESVNIKLLPIGKKPTTRKAPIKKSVAKKVVEGLKPKFKVGDVVLVNYGEERGVIGAIETVSYYEKYPKSMKPTDIPHYEIKGASKDISESNLELYKAPKADHKKLVAKLKAKKGGKEYDNRASLNTETGERRKRNEGSDKKREALPLGKRVSADGSVYYENRLNRADMNKGDKFKTGGEIKKADRIEKMVENWKKYGFAISSVSKTNDDADFFKTLKIDQDEVGITSQTGNDVVYYNTKVKNKFNRDDFEKGGEVKGSGWGLNLNW